jgi:hypothetical protein
MISLAIALLVHLEDVDRTPAIYRFPAKEATEKNLERVIEEPFDTWCAEPRPSKFIQESLLGQKIKLISPSVIDTPANLKWRNATIDYVNGKLSPQAWLNKTANLHETVHFLSSPKTPDLRSATPSAPMDGAYSARSVFAELLLLTLPGKPCLTSGDLYLTKKWPDAPGKFESWILAMNDFMGPMLASRHSSPYWITNKPKVVFAATSPGLMILKQTDGKRVTTFYYNNGFFPVDLPKIDTKTLSGMTRGLDLDGPKPKLHPTGLIIQTEGED